MIEDSGISNVQYILSECRLEAETDTYTNLLVLPACCQILVVRAEVYTTHVHIPSLVYAGSHVWKCTTNGKSARPLWMLLEAHTTF